MYGAECRTICQSDDQNLGMAERKVLQRIYGGIWRSKYFELYIYTYIYICVCVCVCVVYR
jgi:hypothetical protein